MPPAAPAAPADSARSKAERRARGAVDLTPGPGAGRPFVTFAAPDTYDVDDATTRLRPVARRRAPRLMAGVACLMLGVGLLGGGAAGSLLAGEDGAVTAAERFKDAAGLWHNVPVDALFPPRVRGDGAGPGGADRTWTRIAVAPDSGCEDAFDPLLSKALAPVGCSRLLRATYTDATRSQITTVGLLFTKGEQEAMQALHDRFEDERLDRRADLMPRTYPVEGTVAADFGSAQRASWHVSVLTDAPVVVYAVTGFADGRKVFEPQAAGAAVDPDAKTTIAQAGLGHDAKGLADRVERSLREKAGSGDDADGD
ncbi:hypothetical protein HUT18_03660 [Streptomyces sp. NA04227]|uniref:hypothetical protein n=1 Tax=Streptomyces sp. NA04227 TaxID=2742136 RepID=UPI0015926171|nr:hypothetical protein [Streptomyces sp. NA04227]QKW05605.1 hypothetical protein HUT18_03660 [Streptomyces sp. NA04227]